MGVAGGELLTIDGIDMRQWGFNASTRTGRYNVPARRGENDVIPGRSGAVFIKNKPFEEGFGALAVWVVGATQDEDGNYVLPPTIPERRLQFEQNMETLMRFFTQPHKLSEIRTGYPDGSVRRALVEWREWSEPEIQAGGTRAEFAIAFTIPGVWWEDVTPKSQSAIAGTSLPKTLELSQFKDMTGIIEDGTFTVHGPISNPRITDLETGVWVRYAGSVASGSQWVVNADAATSMVGSSSVMASTTHGGSYRLMTVANCYGTSTTPRLQLTGSGGGTTTNLTVTARRKWAHG